MSTAAIQKTTTCSHNEELMSAVRSHSHVIRCLTVIGDSRRRPPRNAEWLHYCFTRIQPKMATRKVTYTHGVPGVRKVISNAVALFMTSTCLAIHEHLVGLRFPEGVSFPQSLLSQCQLLRRRRCRTRTRNEFWKKWRALRFRLNGKEACRLLTALVQVQRSFT